MNQNDARTNRDPDSERHAYEAALVEFVMRPEDEKRLIETHYRVHDARVAAISKRLKWTALRAGALAFVTAALIGSESIAVAVNGVALDFAYPLRAVYAFAVATLGGVALTARRLGHWAASDKVSRNFVAWYAWRPFVGGLIGFGTFLLVSVGLIPVTDVDPVKWGPAPIGALAFLSGMFAKQATDRFQSIAEGIFGESKDEDPKQRTVPDRSPEDGLVPK